MHLDFRYRQLRVPRGRGAPRRKLNPLLVRQLRKHNFSRLAVGAGFSSPQAMYVTLRDETVSATPLLRERLTRLADAVNFPRHHIFLDGD